MLRFTRLFRSSNLDPDVWAQVKVEEDMPEGPAMVGTLVMSVEAWEKLAADCAAATNTVFGGESRL